MTLNVEIDGERLTLYQVGKYVLKYSKMSAVHKKWCDDFETELASGTNKFIYMRPRGSYKSTVHNISTVISLLIDDYVTNGRFTQTILICSATDTLANNLLSEVSEHLQTNEILLDIFDPYREGYIARSNQKGIWFKNREIRKEPNIACVGALSSIVSLHFSTIIVDDISNNEDRESLTVREKKWRWMIDLMSILTAGKESLLIVIGTRWAVSDCIDRLVRLNESLDEGFKYHVEIDGVYEDDGVTPRYPTIYNEAEIENLKKTKGKIEFASQYLNVLLSEDTMVFDYNTFSFYNEIERDQNKKINFNNYRHFLYCDPALGNEMDYSVILVGAIVGKKLYLRDGFISNTTKSSQLIKQIERLNEEYKCLKCGIESNGFQSLLVERINEINEENKKIDKRIMRIEEVKNFKNKQVRIESIEPLIASGKVVFREDWEMVYPLLFEQLTQYPVSLHDDAPDALEGLIRITINNKFRNTNALDSDTLQKMCMNIKRRK